MAEQNKRNVASILLAIIVIGVFGLYMFTFTVPFSQTVVVTQFGKVKNTFSGSNAEDVGLHFKLPWPIEQVTSFDNRKRNYDSKREQMFTSDEQSILVTSYAIWQIGNTKEDVIRYLKEIGTTEKAGQVMTSLIHDAMSKVVGKHTFENFVSTNPERMKFDQIENEIKELVVKEGRDSYGIEIVNVGIKRLELPEESTKKVFDRMRQEREQLAKKYRAEGDSKARQIRAQAERQASDIENRARAEAIMIAGQGDVEAAKYYKIFADNPSLHNFIKRLETLKEILPRRSTLILDADQVAPFDLLSSKMSKWLMEQQNTPPSNTQTSK